MTKLNTDSTIGVQTSSSSSKTTIEENNKIHKTLTKKPKKNFLTLNKTAVSSSSASNSNRRLSLNSNEILKLTTQATSTKITNSNRRKSLSNPFQLNDSEKQLKKFKSKIDYLKAETLTSYDENLKQIKNDYNNKNKRVSKYFFL